jgi:hypothetical protein
MIERKWMDLSFSYLAGAHVAKINNMEILAKARDYNYMKSTQATLCLLF